MTTETSERIWSGLDAAKVIAGTLAAVSAAVCASFLGVAGTLAGAAVASLIGTVGQELYAQSLRRGYNRLREPRQARISASAATPGTVVGSDAAGGGRSASAASATPADTPAVGTHPVQAYPEVAKTRSRWRPVMLATLAAFVLAMTLVTAIELLTGRALAAMFGDDSAGASTISSVVNGSRDTPDTPAPGVTSDAPMSTTAPAGEPTTTPTDAPTEETPKPTAAPTPDGEPPAEPTRPAQDTTPTGVGRSARP